MVPGTESAFEALRKLVDEQRSQCLWFLRPDWYPGDLAEGLRTLDQIQRHGDLAAFQAAARIRAWLSRASNAESAES